VLLSELHVGHVEMAFRRPFNEGMIPATARRLFSTQRTALNAPARERLIPDNPARYVKLPRGARPHAVVWTKRRVKEWKRTGIRPAVRHRRPRPADIDDRRSRAPCYKTKTAPATAGMTAKLRRVLIAAKFKPSRQDQPTPEEIRAIRLAWETTAA